MSMNFEKFNNWIQERLPTPETLEHNKVLHLFGKPLLNKSLWIFNVYTVSSAVAFGLFAGFIPFPLQSLIAAGLAILLRANLPVAIFVSFYANPVTMLPLLYLAYHMGNVLLHLPEHNIEISFSWHWLTHQFLVLWKPLLLGSLICGVILGLFGYSLVWIIHWLREKRHNTVSK